MTNEKEWWKDEAFYIITSMNEHGEVTGEEPDIEKIVAEAESSGERKALEWLRDNASGGGDWRMKIEIKLASLKNL